jgi:hypothetical protein
MALTDDKPAAEPATAAKIDALATRRRAGPVVLAKRYAPFVAMVLAIAAVVAIFGGDTGDGGGTTEVASEAAGTDELIESGPMSWQRAELEGTTDEIDWGPNCDTELGTIKLPSVYASPCVEPFTGDNGGATSQGVTADEVKIVYYQSDPALDPLGASLVSASGADVNPESAGQVIAAYTQLYGQLFETYGRRIVVEPFTGSGASDDLEAARADALAIAEMEPFAVIGGPLQAGATFAIEIASRGIICGPTCASALPDSVTDDYYPYIWQAGPTPDQAAALGAEMIGKMAPPGPAELAGDPALQTQDRKYALVHFDTAEGDHEAVFEALKAQLAENGIELTTDVEYQLDLARSQENARTIMSKLESDGITTVIFYGDPLTPASLTAEATAQDFFPEWILGPSLLADTTIFARRTDGEQWSNGFGLSLNPARGARNTIDAFRIYEWAYGQEPPNNTVSVLEPLVRLMYAGIHMAGPELTPETFRDGLFRPPPAGGGPTDVQLSYGNHDVWPDEDRGGADDATVIWYDPTATGEDETGNQGAGMYRYANGGERYPLGSFPDSAEAAGLFDVESSVTVYDQLPESDQPPDYPSPNLTPPAG